MANFYFWQNTNSIHQSAFLNELVKLNIGKVILVVTENLTAFRLNMGWKEPHLDGVEVIYLYENKCDWQQLIAQNNAADDYHIFSGIAAFPSVHNAFKYAIKQKCTIGIFTEPLDFRGKKGLLRKLRGYYHKLQYASVIKFILTTGEQGISQFINWGYNKNIIFEWAYTVEESTVQQNAVQVIDPNASFKIMFAGSLILRKGYDILIQSLIQLKDKNFVADLYCLREEQFEEGKRIEDKSGLGDKLHILPFLANSDVRKKMNEYDLFILPSRHDGWGAVVSESIMEGTPVLVSKNCGSSTLVSNANVGRVLHNLNQDDLAKEIIYCLNKGKVSINEKISNREWANKHISGAALAGYFENILVYLNTLSTAQKPAAPWKNQK